MRERSGDGGRFNPEYPEAVTASLALSTGGIGQGMAENSSRFR